MSVPPIPSPPSPSHRAALGSLPGFPPGGPEDRLARAREYLRESHARVEAFHRGGAAGLSTCRLLSAATDRLVQGLFSELAAELHAPPGLALVALGSYGRRELSPQSDLDLLLLRGPGVSEESVAPLARAFPTLLWDLKRAVGWSARGPDECVRAADADHTIRTALLDARFLTGDAAVFHVFEEKVLPALLTHRADAYIQDKVQELRSRRERFGDSVFLLEPNLKQGDGGLRDLETALWIARVRFRTRGLTGLLQQSILPGSQVTRLKAARDFLLRIRHQLHFLRGRKEDRLTFDLQEELASFLGYQQGPVLPVEAFMRDYYLAANALRQAADALIARCEEISIARKVSFLPERRLGAFKVFRGKLTVSDPGLFTREPASILDFFRTAEENGLPLYSWAREQAVQALPALETARATPAVTAAFKALFARPGTRGERLFELHDAGVLGTVVPEFGRVTAHHQHDLYHVYTVDVHTLFAVRRLYALRAGDLVAQEPELSREMRDLKDPLPLYLGMLLHDAGKGMGGNHSEKGRLLMVALGERLGLSPRQREVAEFLVKDHLAMSHTAQRRDLSDPALIADFARSVGDVEKLTCLYLLTWADISSVGPRMWTGWKAQLLRELYEKARAHLVGSATPSGETPFERVRFHARWARAFGEARARELGRVLPERYFLGTDPSHATLHARLLACARKRPLAAALRHHPEAGYSELSLVAHDRPGLLSLLTGVLSAHRIDILSARIVSTSDGLALDVFDVRPPHGLLLERSRWRMARTDLLRVLMDEVSIEDVLRRRRTGSLLQRHLPPVPPRVTVDNRASRDFTVVDVVTQDRVGLLHAISSALTRAGVQIAVAKVATEAHRAMDSFYITRQGARVEGPGDEAALVEAITAALDALEREGAETRA
ncbi:[protein-PII] uridylyltransferase [Archangium minus]|uniref:Bifunctional uridylyltransferase/uridylyl-removing enzyme n=1 Tax=Archangium minus TaxID=83450 RepID=A0ABY9WWM3_9BACT|nr:[protein-PII] uridylyltransferase [Archangium violaceum]WNG47546.1 [protein-PII] uridylyltransferase [Archangium minus]